MAAKKKQNLKHSGLSGCTVCGSVEGVEITDAPRRDSLIIRKETKEGSKRL